MIVSSVKLTGNPGPSGWSQVHEFTPIEPDKLMARGKFFAVVATSGESTGVDSVSAGRELLARLHEEYFGKLETSAFNALRAAVENVTSEFTSTWEGMEIAAACVLGEVVYSAAAGGAQAAILRNGAFAKILTSSATDSGQVASISGYPKEGDFLIFGTKKFFAGVSPQDIKDALAGKNLKVAAETLAPLIHSRGDSGNVGAMILYFQKEMPKEVGEEVKTVPSVTPILAQAKALFLGLLKKLPERKIYVKADTADLSAQGNKKVTLSVGAIMLALLFVSIFFGIRQKKIRDVRGRYEGRLVQAEHSYEEAVSLTSLNPDRSRELFLESRTLVQELSGEGVKDKRLTLLLEKLTNSEGVVLGEYKVDPELFLDLSLLTSGAYGDDLAFSGGNLFVLDKNGKRLVRIAIDTKKTETVAGPDQIVSPQKVAGYEKKVFVVEDSGVFEVGAKKTQVLEDTWDGEILAHVFGGNFYILEKGAGIIWRYPGDGTTFGTKQNWFGAGVKPNLTNAVSMAIDGSIWVLNSDGKILKYAQGSPQAFNPAVTLTSADAIYTNEENNNVYILDAKGKRILVLAKDGKYKAQYFSEKIGEATDLAVSEAEGKIILLAGAKLYSISLKHL